MTPADLAHLRTLAEAARAEGWRGTGVSPDVVLGLLDALDGAVADRNAAVSSATAALAEGYLANDSCDDYAREVVALRAERDELAAEVAAYQGRPDGALPGWSALTHGGGWRRQVAAGIDLFAMCSGSWTIIFAKNEGAAGRKESSAPTPRAAMRAAEAKARELGVLS